MDSRGRRRGRRRWGGGRSEDVGRHSRRGASQIPTLFWTCIIIGCCSTACLNNCVDGRKHVRRCRLLFCWAGWLSHIHIYIYIYIYIYISNTLHAESVQPSAAFALSGAEMHPSIASATSYDCECLKHAAFCVWLSCKQKAIQTLKPRLMWQAGYFTRTSNWRSFCNAHRPKEIRTHRRTWLSIGTHRRTLDTAPGIDTLQQ